MNDNVQSDLLDSARRRRPDVTVVVLPGSDGQYIDHATDTIALLEAAGVRADYATDPMAAGVYAQKAADLFLPSLVLFFSDAVELASAINAIAEVFRWFSSQAGGSHRINVEVIAMRRSDGSSRRSVKIEHATGPEAERLLREAGRINPP